MNDERNGFIFGVIIACAMWIIFFCATDTNIKVIHVKMATMVCENNEGIKHIEYNMMKYHTVQCNNGAVFKLEGKTQ